jgi:omega-amidase
MLINIMICQLQVGGGISLAEKIHIFKHKPDFVCLPEYFLIPPKADNYSSFASEFDSNMKKLRRLSNELDTTLVGGSIVERVNSSLFNTSYVFAKGRKIASYRKQNPTNNEKNRGISPGNKQILFEIDNIRIGVLICADIFHDKCFEKMRKLNADLIFMPTVSPLIVNDPTKSKMERDENLFVRAAKISGAYVIKTCGLGTLFGNQLNGRSLVAAPWGIIWKIPPENEQHPRIQSIILDIDELHDFRRTAIINKVVSLIGKSK